MSSVEGRVLTRRQEQILIGTAEGLVGKQIAHRLGISLSTVRHEQSRIARKLGSRTGMESLAVAYDIGLLPALAELFSGIEVSR